MTKNNLFSRYAGWWLDDLPPLTGRLRFIFYAGLFVLALMHHRSPLRGIVAYSKTDPILFRPYGLLDLLGVSYIDPSILMIIICMTGTAWLFAALGLFSRWSAVITAVGALFLHGMFLGSNALNHNWFLSVWTLVLLCFARCDDRWTLDTYIRKWRGHAAPAPSIADTGIARKAVLVMTAGFYFAAGMSKLFVTGFDWMDGHTIVYFAEERQKVLSALVYDNVWLASTLSVLTLVFEVGALAALFSRKARWPLVIGWSMMHIGIYLIMGPRYSQNMLVFVLIIDWQLTFDTIRRWLRRAPPTRTDRDFANALSPRSVGRATGLASILIVLAVSVATLQIFWWPLTNVYMYCSYFSSEHGKRAGYDEGLFYDAESAQAIARTYAAEKPPIEHTQHFAYLAGVRLSRANGKTRYLDHPPGTATWKQWVLTVVRPVLIADLAAKPTGRIEFDPSNPDTPAQRFLVQYAERYKQLANPKMWEQFDVIELTYPLAAGDVPIASVRLSDD